MHWIDSLYCTDHLLSNKARVSDYDTLNENTMCMACGLRLATHIVRQKTWCYDAPPLSGYYLATYVGGAKLLNNPDGGLARVPMDVVGELWYNASVKTWWSNDGTSKQSHAVESVFAWQSMPRPAPRR